MPLLPRRTRLLLLSFLCFQFLATVLQAMELKRVGNRFSIDGRIADLRGIRVASASQTEENTTHLLAQLDDYRAHDLNAITVFYQGSSGGCSDPFSPDGFNIDPAHQSRLVRILRACEARGIVVVVGLFYQMKPVGDVKPVASLRSWDACLQAVRTATRALRCHSNVILNIANENNSTGHNKWPWAPVRTAAGVIAACEAARSEDPRRLVGGGGYDHAINLEIGRSPAVDVLLFDTLGPDVQPHSGHWFDHFVANGVKDKPIVNVESFGAWTGRFKPQGVYTDEGKRAHFRELDDARERPGLSVFLHSNNWCQGPYAGWPTRYDLGGDGTSANPGIRWWFEYLKKKG